MDRITHSVREENWRGIIERCNARPEGQTAKAWLAENGISEKSYYYWLRKLRQAAYDQIPSQKLPALQPIAPVQPVAVAEIPAEDILMPQTAAVAVTIQARGISMEITSAVSETTLIELVKAVTHAV